MDPPTEMVQDGETNRETVIGGQKPLHRFISGEPKCVGIVVLFFGCGELLMGIPLVTSESVSLNSASVYIPFWLGALFVVSGNLSIYTESHPSKKMVTVCLSMYVVTLLGVLVSLCYRVFCLTVFELRYRWFFKTNSYKALVITTEAVLLTVSLCVSVLLVFLSCRARAALKSTKTQVIIQQRLRARE